MLNGPLFFKRAASELFVNMLFYHEVIVKFSIVFNTILPNYQTYKVTNLFNTLLLIP